MRSFLPYLASSFWWASIFLSSYKLRWGTIKVDGFFWCRVMDDWLLQLCRLHMLEIAVIFLSFVRSPLFAGLNLILSLLSKTYPSKAFITDPTFFFILEWLEITDMSSNLNLLSIFYRGSKISSPHENTDIQMLRVSSS